MPQRHFPTLGAGMAYTVDGLGIEMPAGFVAEETMVSFRAPAPPDLMDPRMMQKQLPIRANLVVHRRQVGTHKKLPELTAEVTAELMRSVPGIQNLASSELTYADNVGGVLLMFDFAAGDAAAVRQYHALRLDGATLTSLTMTVNAAQLTAEQQLSHVKTLSSAHKVSP